MKVAENMVSRKMETIQNIFRQAQAIASETENRNELTKQLDNLDIEFRSVAYEAASMNIALKDIEEDNNLKSLMDFLQEYGTPHAVQIHVGLGWALAQQQHDPLPYLHLLEPMMRYRVMDGYGYYEGIFRKRKSIQIQQRPGFSDDIAFKVYDQGIGRSIWYINVGEIDKAKNMIEVFSADRHADLWRGLGIACAYVGGCDEEMLEEILFKAGTYKTQLATGAVMAAISRYNAGYMSDDTELTCRVWCKQNAGQLIPLHQPSSNLNTDNSYSIWISGIEASF